MYFVYQHEKVISNIKEKYFHFNNLKFALYKTKSKAEAKKVR